MMTNNQTLKLLQSLRGQDRLPYHLEVEEAGRAVSCDLLTVESLACAFNALCVQVPSLASASVEQLKKVADRLTHKLLYLLEPLSIVEVDSNLGIVQVRSTQPSRESEGATYYELLVERQSPQLQLVRFTKPSGQSQRQAVPCQVTHEVFTRLVRDLSHAA